MANQEREERLARIAAVYPAAAAEARLAGLPKTTVAWIDVLGVNPTMVDALFDEAGQRVLVDATTRERMAEAIADAGIFDDPTSASLAAAIRDLPIIGGLVDVTDVGGGYTRWSEQVIPVDDDRAGDRDTLARVDPLAYFQIRLAEVRGGGAWAPADVVAVETLILEYRSQRDLVADLIAE